MFLSFFVYFFQTTVNPGALQLENFRLYPTTFSLQKGESFSLKIIFSPKDAKLYEEEIIVACDNCQNNPLLIQGRATNSSVTKVHATGGGQKSAAPFFSKVFFTLCNKSITACALAIIDRKSAIADQKYIIVLNEQNFNYGKQSLIANSLVRLCDLVQKKAWVLGAKPQPPIEFLLFCTKNTEL